MKAVVILVCAVLLSGAMWVAIKLSPLFLNSRIERLCEPKLPKVMVEYGNVIYCRMKADDFRFSLPARSRARNPNIVSGGFDTVDGNVEALFEGTNRIAARVYERVAAVNLQAGGSVTAQGIPGGLLIKFHYFEDR